jgi:hypothetical protein
MKKIIMSFVVLMGIVCAVQGKDNLSVRENPPTVDSAAYVAVQFIKLCNAGDKESILNLCDEKAKKWYTRFNGKILNSQIKSVQEKLDLDNVFMYRSKIGNASTTVTIHSREKGKTSGASEVDLDVKKVGGKWLITR